MTLKSVDINCLPVACRSWVADSMHLNAFCSPETFFSNFYARIGGIKSK